MHYDTNIRWFLVFLRFSKDHEHFTKTGHHNKLLNFINITIIADRLFIMPKKKKGGKKKGKQKKSLPGNESPGQAVKRLLKTYERNCQMANVLMCPALRSAMKAHIEDDALLTKVSMMLVIDF